MKAPQSEQDYLLPGTSPPTVIGEGCSSGIHQEHSAFSTPQPPLFVGDSWRYFVAVAFALLASSNGAAWMTFGPIVNEVKEYFHLTAYQVNMLTSIFMFVYLVTANVNCVTYQKMGLKGGLIVGAIFNFFSVVIKIIAILFYPNYTLLVLSQILGAVTQVLIISVPPMISNSWFLASERTVMTALMSNFMNLGIGLGMIIPPLMVNPENKGKSAFLWFFVSQIVWAGVALLAICVMPGKPKTPPSFAADAMAESETIETIPSLKKLIRNRSFLLLANLSSSVMGVMWALASVLPQVLLPFGVSEKNTGWMGFGNMVSGSLVASFLCYFIGKSGKLKGPIIFLGGGMLFFLGLWVLLLQTHVDAAVAVSFFCFITIGFFSNTIYPVIMELGIELTYPLPEQIPSTALLWVPMGSSLVLIQIMSAILGNAPDQAQAAWVIVLSALVVMFGVITALLVVPIHHRENFESLSAQSGTPKLGISASENSPVSTPQLGV